MNALTKEALAAMIDGREYMHEITRDEEALAKAAGLVVVFGASDDLAEIRGADHDEVGAYGGTTITFSPEGLMPSFESLRNDNTGEEEFADYFRRKAGPLATVTVTWDGDDPKPQGWVCTADVPHATFSIFDEGQPFGRGVVFSLADLANPSNAG